MRQSKKANKWTLFCWNQCWDVEYFAHTKQWLWLWVVNLLELSSLSFSSSLLLLLLLGATETVKEKKNRLNISFSDRDKGIRHVKWSHLFLMRSVACNCIIHLQFIGINAACIRIFIHDSARALLKNNKVFPRTGQKAKREKTHETNSTQWDKQRIKYEIEYLNRRRLNWSDELKLCVWRVQ